MKHLLAGLTAFLVLTAPAFAQDGEPLGAPAVNLEALLADPTAWDGQRVAVTGELVGDYSARSDGVWVQVNNDPYVRAPIGAGGDAIGANRGIGARIPASVFEEQVLGSPGRQGRHGPVVELIGTFHHNDPALTGETYLDVESALTVAPAQEYPAGGVDKWLGTGIGLIILATGLSLFTRQRRGLQRPTR